MERRPKSQNLGGSGLDLEAGQASGCETADRKFADGEAMVGCSTMAKCLGEEQD